MVGVDIATLTGRLSQTLFAEPPSAEFTARVAAGKLDTAGAVGCFAREMLADPMAEHGIARFIEQWIGPFDLVSALERAKNPSPVDTAASMTEATFAFASEAILRGDGLLSNLLLDRYAYLNDLNGAWYGDSTLTQRTLRRVELDVSQRVGLFTREYFLAGTGKGSGIVARGLKIRRKLLCGDVPPPPPDLMASFTDNGVETKRAQLEAHATNPPCVGCHQVFDPIGYAFTQFDAFGAFQPTEYGVPVDTSAEIVSAGALDGTYAGIEDMMTAIAGDPDVHACVVEHWFNYVFQRPVDPPEISDAARFIVTKATTPEGFSLREMIVLTTETPGFIGEAGR
jgi:Protein of unknown function (DUF1588)/Protein of unknown function (DUF1592)